MADCPLANYYAAHVVASAVGIDPTNGIAAYYGEGW